MKIGMGNIEIIVVDNIKKPIEGRRGKKPKDAGWSKYDITYVLTNMKSGSSFDCPIEFKSRIRLAASEASISVTILKTEEGRVRVWKN